MPVDALRIPHFVHTNLPSGTADEINVIIEVPKGSSIKYELDAETGAVFVDRRLFTTMVYPCNYGFVPRTIEGDGDPVDVLVLGDYPVVPMSVIRARPVGVLLTEDEEGPDAKVIAAPIPKIDPSFAEMKDIGDVPRYMLSQIEHFFEHYKELEDGKYVKVKGWESQQIARRKIAEAIERFRAQEEKVVRAP
jgi:inorganic pyrophosphatase